MFGTHLIRHLVDLLLSHHRLEDRHYCGQVAQLDAFLQLKRVVYY